MTVSLEVELQGKLNQSWISGCGDTTKVDRANAAIGIAKIGVVENVEELRSELKDLVFTDPCAFHHREIEDDIARSVENVTTESAESSPAAR